MFRVIGLFILAGLAEIGGGYLIWQWLREGRSLYFGLIGGLILALYGVIATMQVFSSFGRVYAAYGGTFIVLSLLWGWGVDRKMPDLYDWIGALICIFGVAVILLGPRQS
ncbi:YnfA family protein [Sporolactobacillus kofuensis]|uniref:YnfA family protein n=1 Tax=Sporolactobacillus kofuensis TaxID=269672 RepID=A0ABW1WGG6_9BACL|nr:YnfA family protein [Sporolactobacillus kofuensis]MCO7177147.1 YnfA family protein [Sporolactobacillus kofuensis]